MFSLFSETRSQFCASSGANSIPGISGSASRLYVDNVAGQNEPMWSDTDMSFPGDGLGEHIAGWQKYRRNWTSYIIMYLHLLVGSEDNPDISDHQWVPAMLELPTGSHRNVV